MSIKYIILLVLVYVAPAVSSATNYTLPIFGNANLDDSINESDITYIKEIMIGKSAPTELADANLDGNINEEDIRQIESIIKGDEDHLTLKTFTIYENAKIVTVPMPVLKIVILNLASAEAIRCIKAEDMVIGIGTSLVEGKNKEFFQEFSVHPTVGKWNEPDIEAILTLKPDIVIADLRFPDTAVLEDKLVGSGITVIRMGFTYPDYSLAEIMALGYILGRKNEAKEFNDFAGRYIGLIENRVSSVSLEKRPRVYAIYSPSDSFWKSGSSGSIVDMLCGLAGGINIAHNLTGGTGGMYPTVDPEWVIQQNPQIIFSWSSPGGYGVTNITAMSDLWKRIIETPELARVDAVKNKRVYLLTTEITSRPRWFVGLAYLAKWFYPSLFEDMDPEAIHREYLEKFQGNSYQGVFVYPQQT